MTVLRRPSITQFQIDEVWRLIADTDLTNKQIAERLDVNVNAVYRTVRRGNIAEPPRSRSNTGYWGVTANGARNRFYAALTYRGRRYILGIHRDPESAARAYDAKGRELGFPPERLNFPEEIA